MASTSQVNVRMSPALKQAGDKALSSAGISPSEVVRAAYARAAKLSHSLHDVSDIVVSDRRADEDERRNRRIETFERSARVLEDVAARHGLRPDVSGFVPMTEVEIEQAHYQDYLAGESV